MCHDRHALQRLIRGPFKQSLTDMEEKRIIGVPANLRHAIMTLPHVYAPRLDAAVHLRSQFQHFEQLIGPDDPGDNHDNYNSHNTNHLHHYHYYCYCYCYCYYYYNYYY